MEVTLIMYRDDGDHRPFNVTKPSTTIGRREDCDLRIAVGDVSRKHCKLTRESDGSMTIEDLQSSNGTLVNGVKVQRKTLAAGDLVQIGPVRFVVQIDGEPEGDAVAERLRGTDAKSSTRSGDSSMSPSSSGTVRPPRPTSPKSTSKASNIDDEIDELSILNDSSGESGIDIDLDDSKH